MAIEITVLPSANIGVVTTTPATLTLSMGVPGPKGDAGTIEVGTVSTVPYGVPANVTNSGTNYAAILNFTIPTGPQGATGATGSTGQAATIAVGSVNTLPAGSSATVTNAGSSSAAVFNFGIPQGLQGVAGTNGTNGTNGVGVPSGGSTNQVLAKIDGANYNTQWITLPSAPVTSVAGRTGAVTLSTSDISGMSSYLTTASASSTYQTLSGMSAYLTTASAASTYVPLAPNDGNYYIQHNGSWEQLIVT